MSKLIKVILIVLTVTYVGYRHHNYTKMMNYHKVHHEVVEKNEVLIDNFNSGNHDPSFPILLELSSLEEGVIDDVNIHMNLSDFWFLYHTQLSEQYGISKARIYENIIKHSKEAYELAPNNVEVIRNLGINLMIPLFVFINSGIEFDGDLAFECWDKLYSSYYVTTEEKIHSTIMLSKVEAIRGNSTQALRKAIEASQLLKEFGDRQGENGMSQLYIDRLKYIVQNDLDLDIERLSDMKTLDYGDCKSCSGD